MKQFIFPVLLLLSFHVFAGDDDKPEKSDDKSGIGFKGGLVLSTAGYPEEGANAQKNRFKPGGFGGICYERQFGDVVAVELEAMYACLGVRVKQTILGNDVSINQNFHVAQLPLNLKFYIIDQFNIYVGGYAQYMFAMRWKTTTKDANGDVINEERSDNILKDDALNPMDGDGDRFFMPWDAGIQGGVEFISNMGLGVGARFQKGFIDITNKKFALDDGNKVTNTSLQIYFVGHF